MKKKLIILVCMIVSIMLCIAGCSKDDSVKSVTLLSGPAKTEYNIGEELDLTGTKLKVEMVSGETSEVVISNDMVSGYDADTAGEQIITVKYQDKEFTFKVIVSENEILDTVKNISLKSAPDKTLYSVGEELDLAGAKINVEMTSGKVIEIDVTSDMVSGYDAQTVGEQTITLSYEDVDIVFNVVVSDTIKNITLRTLPKKLQYNYGDELDISGAEIEMEMASGEKNTVDVTENMISGYDKKTVGEQTVTVKYEGVVMTFKVTVSDYVTDMTLISVSEKVKYNYGEKLILDGAVIELEMASGAIDEKKVTSDMVSGYNANIIGEQTITVTYGKFTARFKVTVVREDLYTLPTLETAEDLPMIKVGDTVTLTLRSGATVSSSNTSVATVLGNKISGVGYGTTIITVSDGDETKSFTLVVKRDYTGKTVVNVATDLSTTTQGVNNLYVYRMDNGDIENDLATGLTGLELYAEGDAWWNTVSFIGNDHFGGRGTGAIAYRASVAGNYTLDYSAWLLGDLRKNAEYTNWEVDGFSTGIAKRDSNGNISVVVSNIGTKESVHEDATRYQMGTYTVDLAVGEELIIFFCSNGNGDCDEVYTDIKFIVNSTVGE